jgi:enoyl-[acyl-carrier protein] reductase II
MLWIATAELAAAVSNSGGLGVVSPLAGMNKKGDPIANLEYQLHRARELTSKPFGVNIPLDLPYSDKLIDLVINHKVGIVITAAGSPYRYSTQLKDRGITVLHVISSVKHAVKAETCGVDGVVAEGIEAAAHNGAEELPLFSLIPQVVDAISIPVIAAGGIVDDRGLVAAMALGAEGVQLGTRFVAVEECIAHLAYKRAIIDAKDTDTFITCRSIVPTRSLKTDFTLGLIELEKSGADPEVLREYIGYRTNWNAQIEGDLNHGEAYCGASAGLIKEILPARELIQQLVDGYSKIIKKLR